MIIDDYTFGCLVLFLLYLLYYVTKCGRPSLVAAAKSPLPEKLVEDCPILSKIFYPCFFFALPDLQSLTREISDRIACSSAVKTTTTLITLPDEGQICYTEPSEEYNTCDKKLIVVIVPGYMGDHKTAYVLHLVHLFLDQNIWSVVFTDRGKGGMTLKSAKFFSAGYNDGLAVLMDTVIENNPNSNIVVLGISFGGMVAANTLYKYHWRERITAQILVSTPLESLRTIQRLNSLGHTKFLYNIPFGNRIKTLIKDNKAVFRTTQNHKKLYKSLLRSGSMTDIDNKFIAPMFGYSDAESYYKEICLTRCLRDTDVYTICINSDDDPCFSSEMYPLDTIRSNPQVCLIRTKAGGHYGFAELFWPLSLTTYSDKIILEILEMVKHDVTKNVVNTSGS